MLEHVFDLWVVTLQGGENEVAPESEGAPPLLVFVGESLELTEFVCYPIGQWGMWKAEPAVEEVQFV